MNWRNMSDIIALKSLRMGINMDNQTKKTTGLTMTLDNYKNTSYSRNKTIHELFREQVCKFPNRNALICNDKAMTYEELNKRSEAVAAKLLACGVKQESIVGVMLEPSFNLITAILGILKAGGAYMVIDTAYPEARITYMLQNCEVNCLIMQQDSKDTVRFGGNIILIDEVMEKVYDACEEHMSVSVNSGSLAYVLFTSGTTGNPKASMEEHGNVVNVAYCLYTILGEESVKNVLQFFNPSFTVSYQEMFTTLLFGGTYHIVDSDTRSNTGKLFEYIEEKKISTVFFPTSYLKVIAKEERYFKKLTSSLKHILAAGEKLMITQEFLHHLEKNKTVLYNNYGASEVNMAAIYPVPYTQAGMDNLPIGKPNFNTYIYILDENKNPLPVGSWGELYIAGDSVGRGYYNNRTMTAERFVENLFHKGKMYKSGDIGKWNEEGYLVLQGRSDLQANIKGYRVETGEVEYHLTAHPFIAESAVVSKHMEDRDFLWAFIVTKQNIEDEEIKKYLSGRIPTYMIPSQIIRLEELPKLPGGKVDRVTLTNDFSDIHIEEENTQKKRGDSDNSMLNRIKPVILGALKGGLQKPLEESTRLQDIGIDSLNFLKLVVGLEEAFGMEFDDDSLDLSNFETVSSLIDYIESRKE